MKFKFADFLILATLTTALACAPGCKTASQVSTGPAGTPVTNTVTTFLGQTVTPSGVYSQMRGGTSLAAVTAIRTDPNTVPYLRAVYQVLEATVSSGSYDPNALSAAISAIPKTNIHNPAALEAITTGFALFQMVQPLLAAQVNGQNPFVIPALQGIADGINDALSLVNTPTGGTATPVGPVVIPNATNN